MTHNWSWRTCGRMESTCWRVITACRLRVTDGIAVSLHRKEDSPKIQGESKKFQGHFKRHFLVTYITRISLKGSYLAIEAKICGNKWVWVFKISFFYLFLSVSTRLFWCLTQFQSNDVHISSVPMTAVPPIVDSPFTYCNMSLPRFFELLPPVNEAAYLTALWWMILVIFLTKNGVLKCPRNFRFSPRVLHRFSSVQGCTQYLGIPNCTAPSRLRLADLSPVLSLKQFECGPDWRLKIVLAVQLCVCVCVCL